MNIHVGRWTQANNIKLNTDKSRELVVLLRPRRSGYDLPPNLPGVTRAPSMKVPAVILSDDLSALDHFTEIISSCSRPLYAIRLLKSRDMPHASHCTACNEQSYYGCPPAEAYAAPAYGAAYVIKSRSY